MENKIEVCTSDICAYSHEKVEEDYFDWAMVEETIIDNDAIAHVLGVGGEDLLQHLIGLFVKMVPERIAAARKAAADGDLDVVYQEAHALRSAAGNLGAVKVASLAAALELRAKSDEADGLEKLLSALDERFEQAHELLQKRVGDTDEPAAPTTFEPAPHSSERARIVLVEDNLDSRVLIETILGESNSISAFDNGQDALAAMQAAPPDLLLLDISLPDMDGIEILRRVREQDALRSLPVVAVTAHAMTGDREHFIEQGFDEYVSKPVEDSVLLELVRRLLAKQTE